MPCKNETKISFKTFLCFALLFFGVFFFPQPENLHGASLTDLQYLIGNQDAVLIADPQGKILFSKNAGKKLVPASTLKTLTSLAALYYLGSDYRFATEFYLDKNKHLKVKGYGDPLLISEVLHEIAGFMGHRLEKFNDLVLDDSYFHHPIVIPGVTSSFEPYDAPNGALCVNFNTVYFKHAPNGNFISSETQTPLLPFVQKRIIKSQLNEGRIILSSQNNEFVLYAGHLISYFFKEKGIKSNGKIRRGRVKGKTDALIFRYLSRFSLEEVIAKLLDHSNNFMANQILIATGAKVYDPPGTLEKGVRATSMYAEKVLKIGGIHMVEGSGISKDNRLSARQLYEILVNFEPYHKLMPCVNGSFYKTGTLSGVKTRVGYIDRGNGALYRFVILLNTPGKTIKPVVDSIFRTINQVH
ncbi:MAG: D-alanyl-D-alanine carboxypeptidase [Deltaproteobacteria bacterium]|nr:D-alanyl-D-alanine carboxypeptidase [Deltaproteobacteria bacterium]